MNAFGRSRGGGRRGASRETAPLLVVVTTVAHDYHAALVNISSDGARLSGPVLPAEGEEVLFRGEYVQEFGKVVWSALDQCGIKFETSISAEDVEYLRREANIPSLAGVSLGERAAVRDWRLGVSQ